MTSAFWTIHYALGPVGAAAITAAAAQFGVRAAVVVSGVAYLIIAGCAVLTPIRLARPERAAIPDPERAPSY